MRPSNKVVRPISSTPTNTAQANPVDGSKSVQGHERLKVSSLKASRHGVGCKPMAHERGQEGPGRDAMGLFAEKLFDRLATGALLHALGQTLLGRCGKVVHLLMRHALGARCVVGAMFAGTHEAALSFGYGWHIIRRTFRGATSVCRPLSSCPYRDI